ncbi:lipid II flippase MurJ [Arcanobacterium hippocoleae]
MAKKDTSEKNSSNTARDIDSSAPPQKSPRKPSQKPPQEQPQSSARKSRKSGISTSLAKSSLLMASGTFVSRILGMVRSPILITMILGLNSPIASSFDIANQLPNIVFNILAGGLINAVLVPSIVQAAARNKEDDLGFINKLITISIVILAAITAILTFLAPIVVKIFASTLSAQWYELTVIFAFWCIPQIFFTGFMRCLGKCLMRVKSSALICGHPS